MKYMLALKIIAGVFLLSGFLTVLGAKKLVERLGLDSRVKISDDYEMDGEDAREYRLVKATVNVKMIGMLIVLPGLILTLIAFR